MSPSICPLPEDDTQGAFPASSLPPSPGGSSSVYDVNMPLVPAANDHCVAPIGAMASASPTPSASTPPSTTTTTSAATTNGPSSTTVVDWSRVRLGVDPAPTMFVAHCSDATGGCWDGGELVPYGPLALLPAAQVLNYGQSIFEGLKAYRCAAAADGTAGGRGGAVVGGGSVAERVLLFRPRANAERFAAGAARMAMPPVPPAVFLAALHAVVRANADWVPPASRGSLYLRPLLLGTGPLLGLCPAPSYTFVVYAVPVGARAKDGRLTALDFLIHDSLHRAAPRGVGSTKAAGNYSPCLTAQAEARRAGCHDCIYLDARSDTYLEEGSGCNVFATHGSVLTTPPAAGSILPGVTRASLLALAEALGYGVREAPLTVPDAMRADEMFASGTAMVVQPIGSVTYKGKRTAFCRHSTTAAAAADTDSGAAGTRASGGSPPNDVTAAEAGAHANGTGVNRADGPCARDTGGPALPSRACSDGCDGGDAGSNRSASRCGSVSCTSVSGSSSSASVGAVPSGNSDACGNVNGSAGGTSAAEPEPAMSYAYRPGAASAALTPQQRAALAAAAPPPDPKSLPDGVGPVAQRLYGLLTGIQYGRIQDPFGWMDVVDMQGPTAGPLHLDRLLGLMDDEAAAEEQAGEQRRERNGATAAAKGGKAGCVAPALRPRSVFADPNLE